MPSCAACRAAEEADMHITRLEAWPVELKLTEPYTIAYDEISTAANVFVRLHTSGPLVGHGCAAPDPAVTGETPAGVLAALEQSAGVVAGLDPTRPAFVLHRLRTALGFQPGPLAALDMALWDVLGQAAGLPVWKLLGGVRDRIRTSVTIGILDERQTLEQASRWLGAGFTSLKLKGGLDPAGDAARVCRVRERAGPDVELSLDANQGYTVEQACEFLRGCAAAGLAYLEQPTPRDRLDWLAEVQQRSAVPIMADECLLTPAGALELASLSAVKLFNVKLQKVGGLLAAQEVDAVAAAAGIGVMVGCMDECALGIAAGLALALARANVRHADLDGHLLLADDPTADAVVCRDGCLLGGDRPGLGWLPG
jgi:L-alanine-DL-glutamate epimerase-like enolase superfamily enzyme